MVIVLGFNIGAVPVILKHSFRWEWTTISKINKNKNNWFET